MLVVLLFLLGVLFFFREEFTGLVYWDAEARMGNYAYISPSDDHLTIQDRSHMFRSKNSGGTWSPHDPSLHGDLTHPGLLK